jgi:epothilone synthetase B
VHVKEGRVDGVPGGFYYHHPDRHDLELVAAGAIDGGSVHVETNRAAFDACAFSVFLVADLGAMRPLYAERSRDFCLLEAGYMGQLLMEQAAAQGLGVCAVGALDAAPLAAALQLDEGREIVHSFVAGWPDGAAQGASATDLGASLAKWCAETLPDYMVPAAFVKLEALPLTANGKIDRARLPEPGTAPAAAALPPDGPLEQAVAAIFAEVLGKPAIGRDDVVFDLGGTSVHVVRIHRRLEDTLAASIDIVDVFRYPSVRQLAAHLAARGEATGAARDGIARAEARRAVTRSRTRGTENP